VLELLHVFKPEKKFHVQVTVKVKPELLPMGRATERRLEGSSKKEMKSVETTDAI